MSAVDRKTTLVISLHERSDLQPAARRLDKHRLTEQRLYCLGGDGVSFELLLGRVRLGALVREDKLRDASFAQQKSPERTLDALLKISAELENLSAQVAFRFGATGAYEAIVNQRIQVLREERFTGRQTFGEFMMRRYDPAMRTVKASERRLSAMADRAMRAGNLLRTRVDVERSAQNQTLLESMNARADLQLRLQKTVEGLSVVAISYYAVSLAGYLMSPLASPLATSANSLKAAVTLPVVLLVWWAIRRIRKRIE